MEKMIIERKRFGSSVWEVVAHPGCDKEEAVDALRLLIKQENSKKYKGHFRLVKEIREVIEKSESIHF